MEEYGRHTGIVEQQNWRLFIHLPIFRGPEWRAHSPKARAEVEPKT